MANEQMDSSEYIAQAVTNATRVVIQTMATTGMGRVENVGPRSRPSMKQATFDWNSKDKYTELRNFKLEVKNMFQNSNIS